MKRRISGMIVICMAMIHLGSSICSAADVVVMYAIGLLDNGENAKVLTTEEFNQTATDCEKFRDRIAKAPTLKAMVKNGWTVVHVEQIRAGGDNRDRELNYINIFQGGKSR